MNTVMIKTRYWDIAANIYFPPGFDDNKQYPAIISAHPIGSCKEQTAGNVYGEASQKKDLLSLPSTAVRRDRAAVSPAIPKILRWL